MRSSLNLALAATLWLVANASAFEGRITAVTRKAVKRRLSFTPSAPMISGLNEPRRTGLTPEIL